jgi:hypothetical protein
MCSDVLESICKIPQIWRMFKQNLEDSSREERYIHIYLRPLRNIFPQPKKDKT